MAGDTVYLVTGGCGFIGSHLVRGLLRAGHRVRVLDDLSTGHADALPAAAELLVGDVTDAGAVRRAMRGVDGCFHLAAVASVERTRTDWLGSHRVNAGGTVAVLEAAREARRRPVPVVYASSAAVYGDAGEPPLREDRRPDPISAYGADKLGGELHAGLAWRLFGVPTRGLRFFNVFGPGQSPDSPYSGVITRFCDRIGRGLPITVYGGGAQTRDFVYVGDVAAALMAAMARLPEGAGGVVNVCTGRETGVLELARTLADLAGRPLEVEHEPARGGDILRSAGCPRRLAGTLGVRATATLREGLEQTLDHHAQRLPHASPRSPGTPHGRRVGPLAV